jgi:hypothetical protein
VGAAVQQLWAERGGRGQDAAGCGAAGAPSRLQRYGAYPVLGGRVYDAAGKPLRREVRGGADSSAGVTA